MRKTSMYKEYFAAHKNNIIKIAEELEVLVLEKIDAWLGKWKAF